MVDHSVRIQPYIPYELNKRLRAYAAKQGVSIGSIVESALREYMDDAKDMDLLLRRLDRMKRAQDRTTRDIEALSEAFMVFVQLWFAHTPKVSANEKEAAQTMATGRYNQYLDYVVDQIAGGHRFIDDLVQDVADDEELSAALKD